jgi:hypothetical protein
MVIDTFAIQTINILLRGFFMSFAINFLHEFNHLWPFIDFDDTPNQSNKTKPITVTIYHVYQNFTIEQLKMFSINDLVELKKKIKTETQVMRELILKMNDMPQLQHHGILAGLKFNQKQIKTIDNCLPDQTYTLGDEVIIS